MPFTSFASQDAKFWTLTTPIRQNNISLVCYGVILPALIVIGLIGNLLYFACTMKMRDKIIFIYVRALSLIDFCVCFSLIIIPFWIWKCNTELDSINSIRVLKKLLISDDSYSHGYNYTMPGNFKEANWARSHIDLSLSVKYNSLMKENQFIHQQLSMSDMCFDPKSSIVLQILNAFLLTFICCSNSLRLAMSIDRLSAMAWPFSYATKLSPKYILMGIFGLNLIFLPLNYYYFNLGSFKTQSLFSGGNLSVNDSTYTREGSSEFCGYNHSMVRNDSLPNSFKIYNKTVNILFFVCPLIISTFANMGVIYILKRINSRHIEIIASSILTKIKIIRSIKINHNSPTISCLIELQNVKSHSPSSKDNKTINISHNLPSTSGHIELQTLKSHPNPSSKVNKTINVNHNLPSTSGHLELQTVKSHSNLLSKDNKTINNDFRDPKDSNKLREILNSAYSNSIVSPSKNNLIGPFPEHKIPSNFSRIKLAGNKNDSHVVKHSKPKDFKITLLVSGLSIEFFVLMLPMIIMVFAGYPLPNLFQIFEFDSLDFAARSHPSHAITNGSRYFNMEFRSLNYNETINIDYKVSPIVYILWFANHALGAYLKFALHPTVNQIAIEIINKIKNGIRRRILLKKYKINNNHFFCII
ncbi:unnamed protein product [Gordionus sp. m RMFG-2023]